MSELRDQKLRDLYDEDDPHTPAISTAMIKSFERDVQYLLDHTESDFQSGDMAAVRRRLRRALEKLA